MAAHRFLNILVQQNKSYIKKKGEFYMEKERRIKKLQSLPVLIYASLLFICLIFR